MTGFRKKEGAQTVDFGDTKMFFSTFFYVSFSISKGSHGEPFPDHVPEILLVLPCPHKTKMHAMSGFG